MPKRAATAKEKRHLERVASLPCALCGARPVQVHHIRTGQGMAQRAPHWLTIPLCPHCHENNIAIMRAQKTDELKLLANTIEAAYG